MASSGVILLWILFVLLIVLTPILFLIIKFMRFSKYTGTRIIFEDTSRTNGKPIASLIQKQVGKNARILLTCVPLGIENPKPFKYIAEPNKLDIREKGVWWDDVDVIRVLPHSAVEWFANSFNKVEELNAQSNIEKAQRIGLDRRSAHIENMAEGEATRADMAVQEDIKRQLLNDKQKEVRSTGKPGSYITPNRDSFS